MVKTKRMESSPPLLFQDQRTDTAMTRLQKQLRAHKHLDFHYTNGCDHMGTYSYLSDIYIYDEGM